MQIAVENLGQLQRRMTITIPASEIEQQIETRLKQKAPSIKIKGFRPGKVPMDVIRRNFGDAVRQEVIGDLIRSSFYEAISQEKLDVAGAPQINPKSMSVGEPLEYEAVFEIYPKIELKDLSGVVIEKLLANVSDDDLAKVLEKLRNQYADWVEVDRPAQNGDRVMIDFEGTINGEKFEGGAANNIAVVLGSKSMIAGFEEGLLGAKAGESRDINVTFPSDYQQKKLAGQPAKFAIKVNKVLEPKLPEINDDFAKKLDVKGGMDALRNEVMKSMERELERNKKEHVKKQVLMELLKRNPIEIPMALVDAEIEQMQQQLKQRFAMQTGQSNLPDLPKEHFVEQAKERVTLGLLLAEYIKNQQIKVDNSRVRAVLEEIASAYDNPEQVVNYYLQNKAAMAQIESMVMEEQAVEKLLETANVEEKNVSYDEIVNSSKQ